MDERDNAAGEKLVWRYEVKPHFVAEFERAYDTGGDWDAFFAGAPGYDRTELFRAISTPYVYLTIDYWSKPGLRDVYVESRQQEFDEIDARCAHFTVEERRL